MIEDWVSRACCARGSSRCRACRFEWKWKWRGSGCGCGSGSRFVVGILRDMDASVRRARRKMGVVDFMLFLELSGR